MNNVQVFENGITLSTRERNLIRDEAKTVSQKIREILRNRPDKGYNYGELILLLERVTGQRWSKDTVAARLSELSGSNDEHKDSNGQFPLVKLNRKRPNPLTRKNIEIHLYAWNPNYGQPTKQTAMFDEGFVV